MLLKLTPSAPAVLVAMILFCLPVVAEPVGAATSPSELSVDAATLANQAAPTAAASPVLAPGSKRTPGAGLAMSVASPNPVTVVLGLLGIVTFLFALAWLVRRMNPSALMGGQSMKVLSGLSVGPREKIILVDVGGQQILLGVAPGRVSYLKEFPESLTTSGSDNNQGRDFSKKLKHFMNKNITESAQSDGSVSVSPGKGVEQ